MNPHDTRPLPPETPILLLRISENATWPAPHMLRSIHLTLRLHDNRAHIHVKRTPTLWRSHPAQLLGTWQCPPHQVWLALATLFCDSGGPND